MTQGRRFWIKCGVEKTGNILALLVTNSVMESRLGSVIMGWVESHICTRVPFHPWQRLNTVTLQYKGNINWGKHSNLLSPALITAHIFSHCNVVTHPHSHSQARHNIISSMPSNISGAIRLGRLLHRGGVCWCDGHWKMIIIPGIIARHHYWHIAHCGSSQWTHQKPRGKPCPWSEPSFDGVMTHDTDTMSHEGHIINANYNMATLPWWQTNRLSIFCI